MLHRMRVATKTTVILLIFIFTACALTQADQTLDGEIFDYCHKFNR